VTIKMLKIVGLDDRVVTGYPLGTSGICPAHLEARWTCRPRVNMGSTDPRHSAALGLGVTYTEHVLLLGFPNRDVLSGTRRTDLIIPGSQVRVLPRPSFACGVNTWSTDPAALSGNQTAVHLRGTRSIAGNSGRGCTQRYSARRPGINRGECRARCSLPPEMQTPVSTLLPP